MPRPRPFQQVDVFTTTPYRGNPVAVVLDGEGLADDEMLRVARWTNLSETTFVLAPTDERADYRVRIFTPGGELPFAGHPTLGTCHAWASSGGRPHAARAAGLTVQECAVGLVPVRRGPGGTLAFGAPPLLREGPVDEAELVEVAALLGVDRADVVDAAWVDNGPGWLGVLLESVDAVLAVRPAPSDYKLGVVALHPPGDSGTRGDPAIEVRAFFPKDGAATVAEDPVTGSLNASLAQWLLGSGRLAAPYVARQGTVLEREGRVEVTVDDTGAVWVGGGTVTCITGEITA